MVEVHERLVWGFNFLGMGIYGYFCFFVVLALIHSFDSYTVIIARGLSVV